jgi:8-oxo-dGTP pyrophosphatase MutT (NUDIX family)
MTIFAPGHMPGLDRFPEDLPARLEAQLHQTLPGRIAQGRFAAELSFGRQYGPACYGARRAAVVVLLYRAEDVWHLLLTRRSALVADHAGQVSLPGGRMEPGETDREAALRELEEELGLAPATVHLLGQLSPIYLFVSNFQVTPWVAYRSERPVVRPSHIEVAEVLEVPLAALIDLNCHGRETIRRCGLAFSAPCIRWQGHRIWGGTAMILGELTAVLDRCTDEGWLGQS